MIVTLMSLIEALLATMATKIKFSEILIARTAPSMLPTVTLTKTWMEMTIKSMTNKENLTTMTETST